MGTASSRMSARSVAESAFHIAQRIRIIWCRTLAPSIVRGTVGSGTGEFAAEFHARFPIAGFTGIELSHTGVEIASRRVPSVRFLQRNLLTLGPVDVPEVRATHAVCSEVLEHLDAPEQLLRNAIRYFAPGCHLIITVPAGPVTEFDRHIGHRRHYTRTSLTELLEQSGFLVEHILAPGFPFFNLYRIFLMLR